MNAAQIQVQETYKCSCEGKKKTDLKSNKSFTLIKRQNNAGKYFAFYFLFNSFFIHFFNKYVEHYTQDNTKFRFRFFFKECLHLHSLFTDLCTKTISYSRSESVTLNYTTPSPRSTNK